MTAPDLTRALWRKSSFSSDASNCVEVSVQPRRVAVRDSKNTAGPTLTVPTGTWHAFLDTV